MITRRELDDRLATLENALLHVSAQLPALARDVRGMREALQQPPSPQGEDTPERPQEGT